MQWRVLPSLQPEKMKDLRVLLLGAGTLGCGVARALMGWGCRRMTFVDAGKVSYSNPVRQSLFTHRDAAEGRKKATAAREAVEAILPDAEVADVVLDIPMPGHPHQSADVLRGNLAKLQELIDAHDVVCMLTDSRESRWVPSLLVAAQQKEKESPPLGLTVALGFDSFLVSRQTYKSALAACYFCNDVTAPADSLAFRTLDQQCTVTRPGISGLASSVAVELLAALTQHEAGFAAPSWTGLENLYSSPLGGVPHQVRGYAAEYTLSPVETEPFSRCICCSPQVLQRYADEGMSFLEKVIADSSILEDVSCVCHHNTENHTNRNDAGTTCDKENMQDSFTASLIVTTKVSRDSKVALRKLSLRLPSGYRQQRVQIILLCSEG
ncbi:atg7 [Symbiodinium necroappetens]|uniref:Atg7 protein n=1 Tax=Symbiodinium necroappetens TaxID=1628268 RepID=A0A812WY40_9DINO|nr:atg7 [Symbiodinium necroappetens]